MPWQYYAHFAAGYCADGKAYGVKHAGPVASKRWRYGPGERAKRAKLSYRWRYNARGDLDSDAYNEKQARKYVTWLAVRAGIEIPVCPKTRVCWSGFYSATKMRNVRSYSGTAPQAAYCRRVQAIEWGHEKEIFNIRKDGRRGAWLYNEFVPEFRIEIPHWDFEPIVTEETLPEPLEVT